ncbi:MAG: hypothetical protein IPN94_09250 [Sphingobacteriales bacterium]|nr:hypothetical protein [Sphingobacteriales bacterium]
MRTSTPKATHISLLRSGKCGHLRPKLPIFHSYGAENAVIYAQSYPCFTPTERKMRSSTPKATHISLLRSGNAVIYAQSYPYYAPNGAENAVIYAQSLNANGLRLAQTKMVVQH